MLAANKKEKPIGREEKQTLIVGGDSQPILARKEKGEKAT